MSRLFKGQKTEAIAEFEKARALDDIPWYASVLGYAYAVNGDRAKAERVLCEIEESGKKRYVSPGAHAIV